MQSKQRLYRMKYILFSHLRIEAPYAINLEIKLRERERERESSFRVDKTPCEALSLQYIRYTLAITKR